MNNDKFNFDGVINLNLSHKQDIDIKNDSCNFHQNLKSWRHITPDNVIQAPVGLAICQSGRHNFILKHAIYLKISQKVDIDFKNKSGNFHEKQTSWRHLTAYDVTLAPAGPAPAKSGAP